jgi:hypothetical protein
MDEFWTIPTADVTYTRSQNYTNVMVGEHEIQTFEVVFDDLMKPQYALGKLRMEQPL